MLRLSMSWLGTRVDTEHDVDPDQYELGIPAAEQARMHHVDLILLDWTLGAGLAVRDWLEIDVSVPLRAVLVDASFFDGDGGRLPEFESIHHRDETLYGLGDITVTAKVLAVDPTQIPGWTLILQTGLALPTGHTEANPFALGRTGRKHQHVFFGNGTLDPIVGFESGHAFDGWGLQAGVTARLPFGANNHGFQGPGQINARLIPELVLETWRVQLGVEMFRQTPASWSGEPAKNSGRTDIIAVGGATWIASDAWSLYARVKVPWTVQAEGGQLQIPALGMFGVTWRGALWESAAE